MTISTTIIKSSYSGNGSTTAFTYNFKITDQDDIQVIIRSANGTETVKTLTTHYTVSGVGGNSGTVTFTAGNIPVSGETVVLRRSTPQTQTMDLIDNDPMSAETIETAHDNVVAITQELQEQIDRSLKLSRTNTMTSTEFTVDATNRANKVLAFDSSGEIAVTQELGTFKGTDATTTTAAYVVRDIVKSSTAGQLNNIYICIQDSPSGTLLTNTSYWTLIVDAVAAGTSATAAATSATASANSATASANSATASSNSASAASTSETNAATSETNASNSASAASTSASNASTSETNAATSATNSATSATASANSATASATSATNSSNSATAAATSATNAASSATSATSSASTATTKASEAATSATNAASSASTATTKASEAATSATNAASSATTASNAQTSVESIFDNFDDRFLGTKTSDPSVDNDGNALSVGAVYYNSSANSVRFYNGSSWDAPATSAATSATSAANSASAASTSETNAASSASTASTQATNAASSATAAASSATSAANSLDTFDDRFLGAKSSDPSVDNDGDALIDGALYFDSTNNILKVYDLGNTQWLRTTPTSSDQTKINTVSGIASDVSSVANIAANVTTTANNVSGINSFAERYRVGSSDPSTSLDAGDLAFNTTGSVFKYYDGSSWQQITAGGITDLVQDTTPQLGGDLASNGNDINFADNDKAQFGTGNDLQIYHDGSNSFIKDNGTGVLALRTNGTSIVLQNEDGSETLASFARDGASQLYHDNASKIVTTSTGASITGNIAVTGTVDGRDIATDGTKLDGIEASATADQSNAEIKTAYEANSNTNAFTDAEKTKLSGVATNANNYVLPTNLAGDDINIDTGALTGATVISDLDFNITTNTSGLVTDANATVATRNLTLANLGYTGATNATNNTGTVTSVGISPGTGLDAGSAITSSGNISVTLDLSELTDMTADVSGTNDELILLDSGAERRKRIGEIKLSQFNNDSGFTSNTGDITGVTAGTGLTGGGSSGSVTLNVDVGTSANKIVQLDGSSKLPAVDGSQLTGLGGGIEYAQTWRMTGDASGSFSGYFGGNWELDDSTGAGSLGTAMTNSSGTFSFPVTGMWLIMFQAEALVYNNSAQAECFLDITTNNSSYNSAAACAYGSSETQAHLAGDSCHFIFDVTNTSNCKFKFKTQGHAENTRLKGDTSKNETHFTVIRLGDT